MADVPTVTFGHPAPPPREGGFMHIRWSTVFAFVVAVGLMTPSRFVLAQDDPGPVCMDDMEPGVVQPIVLDAWLGGGAATNFPTNGTRINGIGPATVSISTDWKYY